MKFKNFAIEYFSWNFLREIKKLEFELFLKIWEGY